MVSGKRDEPPGGVARNWSRRDGIRAGSVSGPWRSGDAAAGPPRTAEIPQSASARRRVPAEAVPVHPVPLDSPPSVQRHGARRSMMPAILGAVVAAAAIVVLALFLRPSLVQAPPAAEESLAPEAMAEAPAGRAALTEAPEAAETAAETAAAPTVPASDTAAAAVQDISSATLRLRIGPGLEPEREARIVQALEAAGHAEVEVERTGFQIAISRVGYYRPEDRAAAEALARDIGPALGEDVPGGVAVRDYGNLLPDAQPGRLDLWVQS
jgi:hypothetical protein